MCLLFSLHTDILIKVIALGLTGWYHLGHNKPSLLCSQFSFHHKVGANVLFSPLMSENTRPLSSALHFPSLIIVHCPWKRGNQEEGGVADSSGRQDAKGREERERDQRIPLASFSSILCFEFLLSFPSVLSHFLGLWAALFIPLNR